MIFFDLDDTLLDHSYHIENDALTARVAGWRGVWLDRTGLMRAPDGIERITSLLDVPLLL